MAEEEEEEDKCIVCLETQTLLMASRKRAARMISCGHDNICKACFHRCDKCPVCRRRYRDNDNVMSRTEEARLVGKLRRLVERRTAVDEKMAELQEKRELLEEEIEQLSAVSERQRVLLTRRVNQLDSFVHEV
jgi:hypothetical protein